ncbi:MAG: serine hydrolase [Candidatus Accumulibacter sp.]|nr:serine hydrolase [Accumulibacter sp.]
MRRPRVTRSGAARRTNHASAILLCCSALALTGCGTLSTMALDAQDLNPPRYAGGESLQRQVDALAEPPVASGQTPGMVVGILLPDGSTQFFGYGTTERGGERPDADTPFAVGSLSKGFLATITALLVEDGPLSWDDTLDNLLPPATALSADARDLLAFAAAHLKGAAPPFDTALDTVLKVRVARPKEAAALAWIADDVGGRRINYQIGLVAGYTSHIGIGAERGSTVAVLQNSFNWSNDISHMPLLRLARDTQENTLQRIAINHRGITP